MKVNSEWKREFKERQMFTTESRDPFFELAASYLPKEKNAVVVDLGCGSGQFVRDYIGVDRWKNCHPLDCANDLVETLKVEFPEAKVYRIPDKLPFDAATVDYLHCSHVIEHVPFNEAHVLFKEIDRVMKGNGVCVFSTPLLNNGGFYTDLDHIRPYPPSLLVDLFCQGQRTPSIEDSGIRGKYELVKLIHRYRAEDAYESRGFCNPALDFGRFIAGKIGHKMGLRRYAKTGYTLVIKKRSSDSAP